VLGGRPGAFAEQIKADIARWDALLQASQLARWTTDQTEGE
jgi:hypothetical protein